MSSIDDADVPEILKQAFRDNEAAIRKDEREKIREILSHNSDEDCAGEMNSDECLSYEANCTLCKFDYAVKSLSTQGNK